MEDVSGIRHFVTLPEGLICKRLAVGDDGLVYAYCDDAAGGETSVQISSDTQGQGHIEQVLRINP
jgi:hypothetical protein